MEKTGIKGLLVPLVIISLLVGMWGGVIYQPHLVNFLLNESHAPLWGMAILGAIAGVFSLSLLAMVGLFVNLHFEGKQLARYVRNVRRKREGYHALEDIKENSLVAKRHGRLEEQAHGGEWDHGAWASLSGAKAEARLGFMEFVQSILILLGVFGTICSLGLTLSGASGLLETGQSTTEMGHLMGGMATALSTTMVAIVAYVIHGFFLSSLVGFQGRVGRILEEVTIQYMLPTIGPKEAPSFDEEARRLIRQTTRLVGELKAIHKTLAEKQEAVSDVLTHAADDRLAMNQSLEEISRLVQSQSDLSQ